MKLALIHPAGSNWITGKRDVTSAFNRMAPLGMLSLAAYMEKKGAEVKALDFCGAPSENYQQTEIDKIVKWKPDLIGFTTTTSSFLDAYKIAGQIKKLDSGLKVVFGGVHTSSMGPRALDNFPLIDYAVIGEGEMTVYALLEGESPADIQGLVYRDNGTIKYTGPRTKLCDLDDLPIPAYHMLDGFPQSYALPLFSSPARRGATIVSSRGCPYVCSYCDRSVYGRSFRYNSAEYLLDHMVTLYKRYGIRHFNIYDDLFTLKRKRVMEFCELLASSPYPFTFNCAARVGHVGKDLLRALKASGCWMISLGIESGDQNLLNQHKTRVDLKEVSETVELIRAEGMRTKGLFIMGLPGETPETIRSTQNYILKLGLDDMNLTKFAPFPGSPSYGTIRQHGKFEEDWNQLNCLNFVFLPKGFKSFQEMNRIYVEVVQSFYTSPRSKRNYLYLMLRYPHNLATLIKNIRPILEAKQHFTPESGDPAQV